MTQWMKRHKILTLLAAFLLLTSCGAVLGDDTDEADSAATERPSADPVEEAVTQSPSPTEEAPVVEPTQQEVWAANYDASRTPYVAAVAAALALRPRNVDAQSGSLDACRLLQKKRSLNKRVFQLQKSFALTDAPTYDQALAALDATTATICPEFADFHQAQTGERAKRLRVEEQRRKARERRRKQRAAQIAEEQAQQQYVYYENCTAVENAGAAPIYAGDPGYSSDLDRDGDGVACEQ